MICCLVGPQLGSPQQSGSLTKLDLLDTTVNLVKIVEAGHRLHFGLVSWCQ